MREPIYFVRGKQRFEIRHEPHGADFPYIGYVDGVRSVAAINPAIAMQMLIKKAIDYRRALAHLSARPWLNEPIEQPIGDV